MIDYSFAKLASDFFKKPTTRRSRVQVAQAIGIRPGTLSAYLLGIHPMPDAVRASLERLMRELSAEATIENRA